MLDESKTMLELKNKVKKFCEERDWDQFHLPKELAIGIVTEASELLQLFRFKSDKESVDSIRDENVGKRVREELADVLYFVLRFAQLYDIDLSEALDSKIKGNEVRYPIDRVKGSNKKSFEYH